jgi:hypothetical protein
MFVSIPHHLGQEVNDLEHQNMEEELDLERVPHKVISYIFYIKHRSPRLSFLMYFYDCGSFSMRHINPSLPDCMENLAIKLDNYDLYSISQVNGDRFNYFSSEKLEFFKNPIDTIKNGLESLGLNLLDYEMFVCNWTKETVKSKVTNNSLYNKVTYGIKGYFTKLKDYSVLPTGWKLMTQKEIFDYNVNLKTIYRPDLKLYTNGSVVTNANPSGDIFTYLKNEPPQYKSEQVPMYDRMLEENENQSKFTSLKERVEQRDNLIMLHLIFRKLENMGLEMLILCHMLPVPKYTVGSIVLNFKTHLNNEHILFIKNIYMYLDINYSWNIKYLCADLNDIKKGEEVLNLTYYKQKNLRMIDYSYMCDVYDKIQTGCFKFKILNSLFQGDVAIIERNRKADFCRKRHKRFHDKTTRNKCTKFWCPGPQKFVLSKIKKDIPVIKIVNMELDRIHSYNSRMYTKRLYKDLREPDFLQYKLTNKNDNVKMKWRYTRDF